MLSGTRPGFATTRSMPTEHFAMLEMLVPVILPALCLFRAQSYRCRYRICPSLPALYPPALLRQFPITRKTSAAYERVSLSDSHTLNISWRVPARSGSRLSDPCPRRGRKAVTPVVSTTLASNCANGMLPAACSPHPFPHGKTPQLLPAVGRSLPYSAAEEHHARLRSLPLGTVRSERTRNHHLSVYLPRLSRFHNQ